MIEQPLFLEIEENIISKALQLKELLNQRTLCVIVKLSTCRKTTI